MSSFFTVPSSPLLIPQDLLESSGGILQYILLAHSDMAQHYNNVRSLEIRACFACFLVLCKRSKLVINHAERSFCLPQAFVFFVISSHTPLLFLDCWGNNG